VAFAYSTSIQDRIALTVFGVANSSLTTTQKTHLDGTWTTGSLTTGAAFDALTRITQIANWFEQAGATSAPQAWEHWLVAETAMMLSETYRPERYQMYADQREKAIDAALDSFTLREPTGSFSSSNTSVALSVNGLRFYVLNACARRKEAGSNSGLRRRIFPPIDLIDTEIQWTLNYIYNKEFWNFRKRQVMLNVNYLAYPTAATWTESTKTLTQTGAFTDLPSSPNARVLIQSGTGVVVGDYQVASKTSNDAIVLTQSISLANGNLTTGDIVGKVAYIQFRGLLSGETFDAIASRKLYYNDAQFSGGVLSWVDASDMAQLFARQRTTTGRPAYVRTEIQPPSTVTWQMSPFPDASYVLNGAVFTTGPGTPSSATETDTIGKFPTEFGPVVKGMVLARVLQQYGASDADRVWQRAVDQVGTLLPQFTDQGFPTRITSSTDVYNDRNFMLGSGPSSMYDGWANSGGLT
jgi:hypothetical protein